MGKIMSKVVLAVSNYGWGGMRPWHNPTLAVPIITAILKPICDFSVIDGNGEMLSEDKMRERLKRGAADIVLITALSSEYYKQYHLLAQMAKEVLPDCKVIMGGVYPTVSSDIVMEDENVDYAMLGHAEERLDKLIRLVESGDIVNIQRFPGIAYRSYENGLREIKFNPVTTFIGDLKKMIKPDYSLVDYNLYLNSDEAQVIANFIVDTSKRDGQIISSYGCPYNCIFCATRTISGRKVAYRDVEDVLEEIEYLIEKYNINMITFIDDCLLADRERAERLFRAIIENDYQIEFRIATVAAWHLDWEILCLMKRAGCSELGISVESGCDRVLHKIVRKPLKKEIIPPIVKMCRKLDILMRANFVIGFPGETWEEIRETFQFAEACNFDLINIHIATVLPKTDLYNIAVEEKLLPPNFSFYNDQVSFGFCKGNITTEEFTPGELMVLRAYEWDRINFSTAERRVRACRLMEITEEQLKEYRKQTRIHCGVYF